MAWSSKRIWLLCVWWIGAVNHTPFNWQLVKENTRLVGSKNSNVPIIWYDMCSLWSLLCGDLFCFHADRLIDVRIGTDAMLFYVLPCKKNGSSAPFEWKRSNIKTFKWSPCAMRHHPLLQFNPTLTTLISTRVTKYVCLIVLWSNRF